MSSLRTWLTTLDKAKRELNAELATDDPYLTRLIPDISELIEDASHREFEPIKRTRTITPNPTNVSPDYSYLDTGFYILDLIGVVNGTKTLTVGTDVVVDSDGVKPGHRLEYKKSCAGWTPGCGSCPPTRYKVQVTAWWGWREDYAIEGWQKADKLDAEINASVTAANVQGGVNLVGIDGFMPRFSPGALIRMDDEIMRVVETNGVDPTTGEYVTGAKALSLIQRAQRGTAAAIHTATKDIYVWSVQPQIERAAQRWIDLAYTRRGVYGTSEITDVGIMRYPGDMPEDVQRLLWRYFNER